MKGNYYNEIDPFAAATLRNLIAAGHIAPRVVDERSIEDVRPDELAGYTQCHFFAGVGVWSLALRNAGWPDSRPVWTGSCPCQPFSAAGKGAGFADERHLWPAFYHLIAQCRPADILGEQVASKAVEPWIDLVHADMEALGYAFGCVPFPSAGVGAPHIRDRAYWVANATDERHERAGAAWGRGNGLAHGGNSGGLADLHGDGCAARGVVRPIRQESNPEHGRATGGMADAGGERRGTCGDRNYSGDDWAQLDANGQDGRPASPTNGFWRDADWLGCRDGKWRPVEPGYEQMVNGAPARVGRLRAYGNCIAAPAAQAFIESVMVAA